MTKKTKIYIGISNFLDQGLTERSKLDLWLYFLMSTPRNMRCNYGASIRKRKGRFQARVTRAGYPEQLKTFHKREDAERWSRQVGYDLDNHNLKFPPNEVKALTLKKLILKYMTKVLPFKRYPANEKITLNAFLTKNKFVSDQLAVVTPETFSNYRNRRLVNVKPATFLREIMIISHVYNVARKEWGLDISNPIESIKKPRPDQHRDRVFKPGERETLLNNADPLMRLFVITTFACWMLK